jgi:hypothetical protein
VTAAGGIPRNYRDAAHAFAPESMRLPFDILVVSIRCLLCEFQVLIDLARGLHDALNVCTAAHWPVKSTCFENHVLSKGAVEWLALRCAKAPRQSAVFAAEAGNSPGVFMSSRGDLSWLIAVFLLPFR